MMRTMYVTPEKYARAALEITEKSDAVSLRRPERFREAMRCNRGNVNALSPFAAPKDGMERKNPLIVALGDSITAGHFEFNGDITEMLGKAARGELAEDEYVEITDVRECYLEKFRSLLIDKYEQTSVSVINSGIAGDTIYGMQKRLYRDVIRYQPDLVLINGSANWSVECGGKEDFRRVLTEVVAAIRAETNADVVLMTPNMVIPLPTAPAIPACTLKDRVQVIREVAEAEEVCLADAYRVWEEYEAAGYPVGALMSDKMGGHPSVTGHEMYAMLLMKLMD